MRVIKRAIVRRISKGMLAVSVALWLAVAPATLAATHTVVVLADRPGPRISPTMFGIFFE